MRGKPEEEDVWDELARELELAATESEADAEEEEMLDALKT